MSALRKNRWLGDYIVFRMGQMQADFEPVLPLLNEMLSHSDWDLRNIATNALRAIHADAWLEIGSPLVEQAGKRPEPRRIRNW